MSVMWLSLRDCDYARAVFSANEDEAGTLVAFPGLCGSLCVKLIKKFGSRTTLPRLSQYASSMRAPLKNAEVADETFALVVVPHDRRFRASRGAGAQT
jgi:hypothetical protein